MTGYVTEFVGLVHGETEHDFETAVTDDALVGRV